MIEKRFGTLEGLEAPILVYESTDEANKAAGKPDAALNEMNNNLVYRGPLAEAREIICDFLAAETGIDRLKKDSGRKDKEGKPILVDEAEGAYTRRVCALKGWEDLKHFQAKFDDLCRTRVEMITVGEEEKPKLDDAGNQILDPLAADITQRVRTSKPKVLANKYLETAKKVLSGGKVDKFLSAVEQEVGQKIVLTGDQEKDLKTIGWAAKALCDVRERAMLAAMPGTE